MRPPAPGPRRAETVFGDDPGRDGAPAGRRPARRACTSWISTAPSRAGPRQTALVGRDRPGAHHPRRRSAAASARSRTWKPLLEAGARWAIVGTRAALDPAFLGEVCRRFEDRDHRRRGRRRTAAWRWTAGRASSTSTRWRWPATRPAAGAAAHHLHGHRARRHRGRAQRLEHRGGGPGAAGIPVFASGGVGSLDDIRQLAAVPGLAGVIVGRALYSGAVDLGRALAEVG